MLSLAQTKIQMRSKMRRILSNNLLHSKWACSKQSLLVLQPELLSPNKWACNKLSLVVVVEVLLPNSLDYNQLLSLLLRLSKLLPHNNHHSSRQLPLEQVLARVSLLLSNLQCRRLLLPLPLSYQHRHLLLLLNKVEHNKVLLPWLKLKLNGLTTPTGGIILAFMDTSALAGSDQDHGVDLTTATAADIDDYHISGQ